MKKTKFVLAAAALAACAEWALTGIEARTAATSALLVAGTYAASASAACYTPTGVACDTVYTNGAGANPPPPTPPAGTCAYPDKAYFDHWQVWFLSLGDPSYGGSGWTYQLNSNGKCLAYFNCVDQYNDVVGQAPVGVDTNGYGATNTGPWYDKAQWVQQCGLPGS